jgi:Legume lectin domain/FecR protein
LNYSGKFDAKFSADGSGLHSNGNVHVETVHATQVPADAIIVSDAHLLFNGEFKRSGVDLILSKDDQELVLHDYFKGEKRASLSSPDGAHLTGDLVNALAGHVQYAQADGSASVSHVIGHVTKLTGTATCIRNGVSIILNNGDNVEKGDVIQSGSTSTLGITFIDGTVFGLLSNARMVLNEMVYDPNGSNNSSLLSLVAGTITFVAGETAKHGDMKVDTPVATMGIRGTAVLVEIGFDVPGQNGAPDAKFQVLVEPDGTTGSYILFDKTTLTPLAVVDKAGQQINISNNVLSYSSNPLSPEIQKLILDVFSLKFSDNSNTKTLDHFTDTIVPQSLAPVQLASGATATPVIVNTSNTTFNSSSSSTNGPPTTFPHFNLPPDVVAVGNALTVHTGTTQNSGVATLSGTVRFADINAADLPTVKTQFSSFKILDAQSNDITATLTPQQLAQIAAVEVQLAVTPSLGNTNVGSATWTYSVADTAFNFLTNGKTLTLTYMAEVDTNYAPLNTAVFKPFTITINALNGVEWVHPTGGLWSVGSNWSSGAAPTATDDAIIPAENIPGGTGLYNVTIEAPAVARNLTLNANNTTGGQVTNDSSLTIGEALTILGNGVLNNSESGTVSVGGQLELSDQSSLQNSGFIALGFGGDFKNSTTVTNSGTIEVAGGALNVQVDIANSGGIIQLDSGATLTLSGANISGGAINDNPLPGIGGAIHVTGDSKIDGGATINNGDVTVDSGVTLTLDNVTVSGATVTDNGTIDVTGNSSITGVTIDDGETTTVNAILNNGGVTIESEVTLTLDDVTVTGTTFTDTAIGAIIQIDDGTVLTLTGGATINGGTINDGTAGGTGSIDVTGSSSINNASLNNGGVTIESGVTLTLDNDTVNGTTFTDTAIGATIQIDDGAILTLTGGATIDGGTINDGTAGGTGDPAVFGSINVTGSGTVSNALLNNGGVTVANGATLTLQNDTVNGTTFADAAAGMIAIGGAVILESGVAVNGGALSIARGSTLDIENFVTGTGATLNGVDVMNSGTIQVDAPGPETLTVSLLLDGGTTVTGGTLLIHVDFPTSNVEGAVEIGAGGATLDNVNVVNNNSLTIDDGAVLTLTGGTTINGGILNDGTADGTGTPAVYGSIDVTGSSTISNATLNNGVITIEHGVSLTLDSDTVNGTTIEVDGIIAPLGNLIVQNGTTINDSQLIIDSDDQMILNGATINGGTITDNGMIYVAGPSTISNAILNHGELTIESGQTLTLDNDTVNGTAIVFAGIDSTLKLDQLSNFNGTIVGLTTGDAIDLTNVAYSSNDYAVWTQTTTANGGCGMLKVYDCSGTLESTLNLAGIFSQNQFALSSDNTASHGTDVNINYVSFSSGTINTHGVYTPEVSNDGSTIELTNGKTFEANSWFGDTVYSISEFTVSFDYSATGKGSPADGMAFILQNSSAGIHALGGVGHELGYGGPDFTQPPGSVTPISPSAAIEFNLYDAYVQGTGLATDGAVGSYSSTGNVDFVKGDDIHAVISYNGNVLTETLTDLVNGATYSANYAVDLATVLGATTAYVGFSAATGADYSTQIVSNFAFAPPAESSTIVASAPNQTLSGFAATDTFVFNFPGVAHTTVADFHPATDTIQFSSPIFTSAQAILNATHDDGHGNTIIAIDAHDTITLDGVLKAQLHTTDFHIV